MRSRIQGDMDMKTLKEIVSPELHEYLPRILDMCEAPYAVANGIELVSLTPECTRMRKSIHQDDMNSMGRVHGAALFGLIDHTFAVAANVKTDGTGQCCNIIYHRPCTDNEVESEARLINESKSLQIFDVRVYSGSKLRVSATCTGFKINR
jgi:uncharacterized protein (TIGR00369 family)